MRGEEGHSKREHEGGGGGGGGGGIYEAYQRGAERAEEKASQEPYMEEKVCGDIRHMAENLVVEDTGVSGVVLTITKMNARRKNIE
jgi:hypothetical protein